MDYDLRTFDRGLREERRLVLLNAAVRAAAAVPQDSGVRAMVTGSLSRGQVHPWSDLDIVLVPHAGMMEMPDELRRTLRREILDAADLYDADVVYQDEVVGGLKEGMLGSLTDPHEVPGLEELPDISVAIARIHVSIRYALDASEQIMSDYRKSEERLREVMPDFDRMSASHAMDPLRRKAKLWMKKLAVFGDGGRSPWLDDADDEEALDRLLVRLSATGSWPDSPSPLISPAAAGALRFLLIDAYDFVFRRSEETSATDVFGSVVEAVAELRRDLEGLVPGVPTHGLQIVPSGVSPSA